MATREETIIQLTKKSDPRNLKWEFSVILDTLQEQEEPVKVSELVEEINEKFETDDAPLMDYNSVHYNTGELAKQGAILNNKLTTKIEIAPEYITSEVRFLPVSNYCVALLALSVVIWIFTLAFRQEYVTTTSIVLVVGMLYILLQHLGSEFKTGG